METYLKLTTHTSATSNRPISCMIFTISLTNHSSDWSLIRANSTMCCLTVIIMLTILIMLIIPDYFKLLQGEVTAEMRVKRRRWSNNRHQFKRSYFKEDRNVTWQCVYKGRELGAVPNVGRRLVILYRYSFIMYRPTTGLKMSCN